MTTYSAVLRDHTFRVLFGTRTLSVLADTLRIVALSLLVYAATESPALAALAYGIGFLPQLAGASLLGALADRVRPRRLIVLGYLAEAAVAAVLATVALPVWAALTLVAAAALLTPVFMGAQNSLIAETLTGDAYVLGRSLANVASSLAQLIGMAGAGIAVATLGGRNAMLLAALGHIIAAAWTHLSLPDFPAPRHHRSEARRAPGTGLAAASWKGNAALLRDRTVRRLLLVQWLPPAFITGAEALMVPYAATRGFPAGAAGWLLAAIPVGMVAGNVVVGRLLAPSRRERLVPALIALMGLPCLAFAAPVSWGLSWPVLAAALVVVGVGFAFGLGVQAAFRDALPADGRGQAFGLLSTGLMTAQGLLPALAGLLAEALPTGLVIALLGTATLLAAVTAVARQTSSRPPAPAHLA
ncbi:MFS transporter [Dactylosporangium matsuzakiense]|uniref:MFS transporter n=1 Tax=Dactylosporangium matsuzakiense TaxID=53360 RepID=A0A9W6KPZ1_9ACTN|nr:MFS transporter [Dactylosporangium matsuzakiense]UWZ44774.1 MFS transporter [Dactylosporangium matsuzakiense]GLL06031.1 MFS transporter [Dactylosporangium matsuzakiense]